jgi:NTP pyrophosphatase (non-canonical NTP hydrolase)
MEMKVYQNFVEEGLVHRVVKKPERPNGIDAFLLEAVGEVGELINAAKHEVLWLKEKPTERPMQTLDEAGDVLWYLTAICIKCGFNLNDIAEHNMRKLQERYGYGYTTKTKEPGTSERRTGFDDVVGQQG